MFAVSKIVWLLANPGNLLLIVLGLGFLLTIGRWRRTGLWLMGGALVLATIVAVLPIPALLLVPLETRFAPLRALPERVDGIIVIGGAVNQDLTAIWGEPQLRASAERMTVGVALARRYPEARLVYTGGSGSLRERLLLETDVARMFFAEQGLPESRIALEDRSRNTFENAVYTRDLVAPKPGEVWIVVSSASHMPRVMGCFRKVGWDVLPYPVDYRSRGHVTWRPDFDFAGGLMALGDAVYEWVGLIYYAMRGWTDAVFPAAERGGRG
ncbi:MAG: YdcF family protein [Alphaproteobacteria bacterium]